MCFLVFFTLIFNYIYVSVRHAHCISRTGCFFSVLDCFSTALEVVAVLMLIVYVLEALKKICIINKHVESVGGNGGARHVTYRGEEPRATSTVMATLPAVHIHYSEYIGLSFTLHTTSRLFIRHVHVKGKNSNTAREYDIYM